MQNGNSIEMKVPHILIMVLFSSGKLSTISQEFNSYATAEFARKHIANELSGIVDIVSQGVFQK